MSARFDDGGSGTVDRCFIAISTGVSPGERHLSGEQLVEHDADRVEIGGLVDRARPSPAPATGIARCR